MIKDFTPYKNFEPCGVKLPKISVPESELSAIDEKLDNNSSNLDLLKSLCRKGILEKGINKLPNKKEYFDRAKLEIDTFEELGFVDYVLLNWDIIGYCHKNDIPVGDGRGSAAGSLVLYLLKVTGIDPIRHGLFFERFVSKTRAKKVFSESGEEFLVGDLLPDVDSDISYERRQDVIKYIEEKHKGRTSKILTFNTFSSKLCLRELSKYFLELKEDEANMVSDMVGKSHGRVFSIDEAIEDNPRLKAWSEKNKLVFKTAKKMEGLIKNTGIHPSGIAICADGIEDLVPLQKTKEGDLVSGYDMNDVADLMVKFDILGLRTLTIAHKTCKKIGINFNDIDPEDPIIYQNLQEFRHPVGLFQISAGTNFQVCQNVKPANLKELSDVVALARPASLQFVDEYVSQKNDPQPMGLDEELDKILLQSKNVMLFQEQVMFACHKVFGLSLEEAETLRRVIGKKKIEEIPAWKEKIFSAAEKKGLREGVAEHFWSVVEAAGNYGFNLSHSISYANLAAKTVWLKFQHPQEFFISILECAEFEPDPLQTVKKVNEELQDFGIKLLPPNLMKSKMDFCVEGSDIRYGFNSIKGISLKSLENLVEFRGSEFNNKIEVFLAAKESGISISVLASLIHAGALSLGDENRGRIVLEAQAFNLLTDREKRNITKVIDQFDSDVLECIANIVKRQMIGDDNKPIINEKRFQTFKNNFAKYKQIYQENQKHEKFSKWRHENFLLGYSYSLKLKDCFENQFGVVTDLYNVRDLPDNESFVTVAEVQNFFQKTSQAGNKYMKLDVSDSLASEGILFMDSNRGAKLSEFLRNNNLKKQDIIFLKGNKHNGTIFAEEINIVDTKIFMKPQDLK
jgi:DNA polymerase-3 subunit alpha